MFTKRIIHTFITAVVLLTATTAANATTIGLQGGWEFNLGAKTSLTTGFYDHDSASTSFYFDQSRYGVLTGLSLLDHHKTIKWFDETQLSYLFSGGLISLLNLPLFDTVYLDCNSGDDGSADNGNTPIAPGSGSGAGAGAGAGNSASDVPEPSGVALFGLGLLGMLVAVRRRIA